MTLQDVIKGSMERLIFEWSDALSGDFHTKTTDLLTFSCDLFMKNVFHTLFNNIQFFNMILVIPYYKLPLFKNLVHLDVLEIVAMSEVTELVLKVSHGFLFLIYCRFEALNLTD
jgi:hypothetical protein